MRRANLHNVMKTIAFAFARDDRLAIDPASMPLLPSNAVCSIIAAEMHAAIAKKASTQSYSRASQGLLSEGFPADLMGRLYTNPFACLTDL